MTAKFSKTQIDRLGNRMRGGALTESDLRVLDEYRRTFGEAYGVVVKTVRQQLQLEPTGRPAKSTSSLLEKLHRESIRLSQVQDIAGCRVVVPNIEEQERVVSSLCNAFSSASVMDRRANPSHGYRAVHVIVEISEKVIEIQVRTSLQHLWAEISEKFSDTIDPAIKYGGGDIRIRNFLGTYSNAISTYEEAEIEYASLRRGGVNVSTREVIERATLQLDQLKEKLLQGLNDIMSW